MRSLEEIENAFKHHPPSSQEVIEKHEAVRKACGDLAATLFKICPQCPETTLALRSVQQAMFNANTAIALNCNPS